MMQGFVLTIRRMKENRKGWFSHSAPPKITKVVPVQHHGQHSRQSPQTTERHGGRQRALDRQQETQAMPQALGAPGPVIVLLSDSAPLL